MPKPPETSHTTPGFAADDGVTYKLNIWEPHVRAQGDIIHPVCIEDGGYLSEAAAVKGGMNFSTSRADLWAAPRARLQPSTPTGANVLPSQTLGESPELYSNAFHSAPEHTSPCLPTISVPSTWAPSQRLRAQHSPSTHQIMNMGTTMKTKTSTKRLQLATLT